MSSPSYEPRSYAKQPELFGKHAVMEWKSLPADASDAMLDQIAASKRQHVIAMAIHAAVNKRASSLRSYVDSRHEIEYSRFAAVLRGEVIMKLDDIANAERTLGLSPWGNIEFWSGFRP